LNNIYIHFADRTATQLLARWCGPSDGPLSVRL